MANLIQFSKATSLALHSLVLIAKNQPERMNVKTLAERLQSSRAHLAKVFQALSKSGIVKSVRGPAGGFELNKPIDEISFLDIYEIIEGKTTVVSCPFDKKQCIFKNCIFDSEMARISNDIYETFKNIKLSNFTNIEL